MLSFQLLGTVSLTKDGQPLNQFRSQKETALLIYLAYTGQTHSREFIADLLWEDRSTQQARSNLRTVLARLRKQFAQELDVTRKTLALTAEARQQVDAVNLLQQLAAFGPVDSAAAATALQQTLDAYHGEFLADFYLDDAPQFMEWVIATRAHIHRQVIAAHDKLRQYVLATGTVAEGIALAQRWLALDALDETAHTLLIRLLLKDGQTQAALRHYDYCVDLLRRELDVDPPATMTALVKAVLPIAPIASSSAVPTFDNPSSAQLLFDRQPVDRPRHNLPTPHDQFFGRSEVQQDISERLSQPWCRLITIVGQGGVGKTRLATTVARSCLDLYRDGVWLVELAEVNPEDEDLREAIAVEIATALDLRLSGSATPVAQLLSHLQHKSLLLVLDNFEHLLGGGLPLVLELLERCEAVRLLVTSREALHLRAEWTIALQGLGYPTDEQLHGQTDKNVTPQSDAMDLFVARHAQRQREPLSRADLVFVQQICQLVDGLPLAIELAAALAQNYSLQTIVNELHQGFDSLATSLHDVPHRHRSLQIVFEMSWQTLSPTLQQRLARLSLFRGGFTTVAAAQIADVDREQLAALSEKSLLVHEMVHNMTARRHTLHPVVRTYAATMLADMEPLRQKHAHYYLTLLAQQRTTLQQDTPQQAVTLLMPELENIRLAWQAALAHPLARPGHEKARQRYQFDNLLLEALPSLSIIYQLRGLAHEAETTMQNTLRTATAWGIDGLVLATHAGLEQARFQNRLGRYRAAMETVETALRHAQQCKDHWAKGMGHVLWGESLWRLGSYEEAQTKLNHALTIADDMDDSSERTVLIGWSHHHLGVIDDIQSRYDAALDHLKQACAAWRAIDNMQALSNSLNSVGLVFYHQGDLSVAKRIMEEALALCNQLDNRHLQALMLNNLSILSIEQNDYLSAHHYLQLALESATSSGNLTSQGEIYSNLGKNYYLLGKPDLAVENLQKGLQISESTGNRTLMATVILTLANTEHRKDDVKRVESLYTQALRIARQDNLQHIECEALIGMAELLSKRDDKRANQYSEQAVILAKVIQNPDLLKRANAIARYSSVSVDMDANLST